MALQRGLFRVNADKSRAAVAAAKYTTQRKRSGRSVRLCVFGVPCADLRETRLRLIPCIHIDDRRMVSIDNHNITGITAALRNGAAVCAVAQLADVKRIG